MGVDVADGVRFEAGVLKGASHGSGGAAALGIGGGDVGGVAGGGEADDLGKDLGAACASVLLGFQYEDGGAFGEDEAVALVRNELGIEPYDLMDDAVKAAVAAAAEANQ